MKAILEKAIENGDVSRKGVYEAATSLESVDSEGTLPEGTGNYAAEPNEQAVRVTQRGGPVRPAEAQGRGRALRRPTAENHEFSETPCYE